MLISEKMNALINEQIRNELANSNQYVAIAVHCERECLFGLAKVYSKQAEEEREHAMKFVHFVTAAGGKVEIHAVPAPQNEFESVEEAARLALETELRTTRQINELMALAVAEGNYHAQVFLQWFVTEQFEEVSTAETHLAVIRRAGHNVLLIEAYFAHAGL
jgi:bacterioferritin B